MKVCVTGGAGFIGSHVVDLLCKQHDVFIIDNLSTGKKENVNKKAKFYKADLRNKEKIETIFKKEKPEAVFHLAAQINVRKSISDPIYDADVNVIGTINLLEACRNNEVKKIIYSSSGGAVYGEPKSMPLNENHPINPLSHYGASKYAVEKYIDVYRNVYGLKTVVLRYGNVYGPRQDPAGEAGVISIFIDKILKNEKLTVFGDGNQTRDFVYVEDVANANILALTNGDGVYNIGTGMRISVNQIIKSLEEILSIKADVLYSKPIPGEVRHTYLDISKAKRGLGFTPRYSFEKGLELTVEWQKNKVGKGI